MAKSTMVHARVDEDLRNDVAQILEGFGITISDLVRMSMVRVREEGGVPVGLAINEASHDAWFRAKVQDSLDDTSPATAMAAVHEEYNAWFIRQVERGLAQVEDGNVLTPEEFETRAAKRRERIIELMAAAS